MKPEAIRIAISEACGWKLINLPNHPNGSKILWKTPAGEQLQSGTIHTLPDYLNDLNAMQAAMKYAAEHLMDSDQWEEFGKRIEQSHPHAMLNNGDETDFWGFATLMAETSAATLAESFLRTLNLWKEEA